MHDFAPEQSHVAFDYDVGANLTPWDVIDPLTGKLLATRKAEGDAALCSDECRRNCCYDMARLWAVAWLGEPTFADLYRRLEELSTSCLENHLNRDPAEDFYGGASLVK